MIFKLLYHKPTQEVLAIKRESWQFSDAEQEGDFEVVPLDTDLYNATTRKWEITLDGTTYNVSLSKVLSKIDGLVDLDVMEDQDIVDLIEQKKLDSCQPLSHQTTPDLSRS